MCAVPTNQKRILETISYKCDDMKTSDVMWSHVQSESKPKIIYQRCGIHIFDASETPFYDGNIRKKVL